MNRNPTLATAAPSGCATYGQPHPTVPTALATLADEAAVNSQQLLQGRRTLTIAHNGALYRLQATRQGKLILTK